MPKPKAASSRYLVLRHTSIPNDPRGDPNDAVELEPGSVVDIAELPKRINPALLVARGAWKVKE